MVLTLRSVTEDHGVLGAQASTKIYSGPEHDQVKGIKRS